MKWGYYLSNKFLQNLLLYCNHESTAVTSDLGDFLQNISLVFFSVLRFHGSSYILIYTMGQKKRSLQSGMIPEQGVLGAGGVLPLKN